MKQLQVKRMNSRGSAMLTVVLVVTFLTILATTLMYITGMNFQIKQADYQNKKNFYTGETALEEIKSNLSMDASKAAAEAYNNVTLQFVSLGTKELRQLQYNNEFVTLIQQEWDTKLAVCGSWDALLIGYYTDTTHGKLEIDSAYDGNGDGAFSSGEVLYVDPTNGLVKIQGVRMKYTNEKGLTTIISTDLEISAPAIDWSAEGTLTALAPGDDSITAAMSKKTTDVTKCVRYTDWKKE